MLPAASCGIGLLRWWRHREATFPKTMVRPASTSGLGARFRLVSGHLTFPKRSIFGKVGGRTTLNWQHIRFLGRYMFRGSWHPIDLIGLVAAEKAPQAIESKYFRKFRGFGLRTPSPPPSHLLHGLIAAALPQTDRTQVSSQGGVPRLEPRTARTRTQRAARSRSDAAGSPTAALPLISLSTPLTRSCPLALPSAPTFAKRRRQMRSAPPIRPRRRQMSKRQQAPAPTLSLSCRWATGRPWRRVSRRG